MPDLTPTPPADTRQQAAEGLLLAIEGWQAEGLGTCPQIDRTNYPDAWSDVVDAAARFRVALASSSPALPEPPAPTHGKVWTEWRLGMGTVAVDPKSRVLSVAVSVLNHTPAEVRLLASTLLAAADVAEEQQP